MGGHDPPGRSTEARNCWSIGLDLGPWFRGRGRFRNDAWVAFGFLGGGQLALPGSET